LVAGGARAGSRGPREFDGWIASGAKTSLDTLAEGIGRYRAAGGKRAVVTNIAADLSAPTEALDDRAPFTCAAAPMRRPGASGRSGTSASTTRCWC
jgi:hypothetical protein